MSKYSSSMRAGARVQKKFLTAVTIGLISFSVGLFVVWDGLHAQSANEVVEASDSLATIGENDLVMVPPEGWEVVKSRTGSSLVIQKPIPKEAQKDYENIYYSKNITVAEIGRPKPIDFEEMVILKRELLRNFSKLPGVNDYKISLEEGVYELKNTKGILLYSSFTLNSQPMTQMNLFVSGSNRSYLISYVDLAKNFDQDFKVAWNTVDNLKVSGEPPFRYSSILKVAAILSLMVLVFILGVYFKNRKLASSLAMAEGYGVGAKDTEDMDYMDMDDGEMDDFEFSDLEPKWNLESVK